MATVQPKDDTVVQKGEEAKTVGDTVAEEQIDKVKDFEDKMLALKISQIEMAKAFEVTEEARKAAVLRIEQDYEQRKKERESKARDMPKDDTVLPKGKEAEEKFQRDVKILGNNVAEEQIDKVKEFEDKMLALKTRQIEMAKVFEVTEEARKAAVSRIEQDYEQRKKERESKARDMVKFELDFYVEREIRSAAEIGRLKGVAKDAEEVKGLALDANQREAARKRHELEVAKERYEAIRAAADLEILAQRLDTHNKTHVDRPIEIPSMGDCCKLSNFDDTTFMSLCSILICPYPGQCIVQNYLMKSLHIEREAPGRPKWDVGWNTFGFAGLGLATCCLGLAWNRERITDETASREGNCCIDTCFFMCCLGFFPLMRDEMFTFPIKPKVNKNFKENMYVCFNTKRMKKGMNCFGCLSAVLCPIPSICVMQACTIIEVEEVTRSVTVNPVVTSLEKRSLLIKHCLIGCCGCCIGLALNRSKIANGIGIDEHCGLDCLRYMCCFQCMAVQECYSVNEMRNPSLA